MLAQRKQGPVLPTLVITITDKERKRRSSRAGSLIPTSNSNKETGTTALWFRTPPGDQLPSLQDWARFIMSKKVPMSPIDSPLTPTSIGNFSPRPRDVADYFPRPGSVPAPRSLHHKSSNATYSTGKERPLTLSSESPSLRSKRSDISTPSSNFPIYQTLYTIPGQHYTTVLPTDLPSPINTTGGYRGDFIEGWTAAQGRSSTMSSPHGRDSISSHAHQLSITDSSSPPAPRETILDRAFQMRYTAEPKSKVPGEEKLSSVARFDALMREADKKRRQREAAQRAEELAIRSTFEADDSSEYEDGDDTDTDDDNFAPKDQIQPPLIPPSAQRALQYITGRTEPAQSSTSPRPSISRNNLSFHAGSSSTATLTREPPNRPHTAHGKSRSSQRAQSTQCLPSASIIGRLPEELPRRPSGDLRQSSSSNKRLSFTEFTKRLSSTSSLLLVQTNASGASSRRDSEVDSSNPRNTLKPPGSGPAPRDRDRIRDEQDKRCSWRGGVAVEGGFF